MSHHYKSSDRPGTQWYTCQNCGSHEAHSLSCGCVLKDIGEPVNWSSFMRIKGKVIDMFASNDEFWLVKRKVSKRRDADEVRIHACVPANMKEIVSACLARGYRNCKTRVDRAIKRGE